MLLIILLIIVLIILVTVLLIMLASLLPYRACVPSHHTTVDIHTSYYTSYYTSNYTSHDIQYLVHDELFHRRALSFPTSAAVAARVRPSRTRRAFQPRAPYCSSLG